MNFLSVFENRVSGIFGSAQAPFSLKKLAKQAAREMEDQTLVVNGVNTAPALFTVLIAAQDDPLLAPFYQQLAHEVNQLIKAQAEKRRYTFVGDPLVRFMIDPSLKSGKFSVFAENVDAPTLGRLYEEERAYQQGQAGAGQAGAASAEAFAAPHTSAPDAPAHAELASHSTFADESFASSPAPIPVPQTMLRDQLPGMGGAAATGAALGVGAATSVAGRMAQTRQPAPQSPLAELVDVVTGEAHRIMQARCIIGRERSSANLVLRDPNVSRRHAELSYTGSDWCIEDLRSTNGTLVNNRRITRCPLRSGDLLTFGLSTFEFRG
ncbi:DUF3662 and FHA domain-containing protein [Collinsella sp. zg1085]|uniref:FhaA domain-containing protein n=1 Tax=Collinsella sp. zg1085 TaxID=2844380 RepID=UPI001C0CCB10|nr:DUF3662 and FHA domain-containing protein [Collinsella sp. zg1085]QWT17779.1 DUF3662 and FHA domain-containing protein [Collinsella sp. zg1085]